MVVIPRIRVGPNISEAIQTQFDQRLRDHVGTHATVADEATTQAALQTANIDAGKCVDAACARKLAAASGVRFVVTGHITNVDEIYTVTLAIYDAAFEKVTGTSSEACELCAVEEVPGTLKDAVGNLAGAFAAPPPVAAPVVVEAPKPPPVSDRVPLRIQTDPPLAVVDVDGNVVGRTPLDVTVTPGKHTVTINKEGFEPEVREIMAGEVPLAFRANLSVVAEPDAAMTRASVELRRSASYAGVGWVMTLVGAVLGGVGAWFIVIDGDVTCDDGRGRHDCPTVLDTKGGGLGLLAVGSAALGAGVALLIVDPGSVPGESESSGPSTAAWSGRF